MSRSETPTTDPWHAPLAARRAGAIATAGFALVALLQLLLAAGVLPVTMAWGGSQPVLTVPLRLASVASALVLGLFALVIRRRAGLAGSVAPSRAVRVGAWVITGFLLLNTVGNVASSSAAERVVFGPITLVLLVACAVVAGSRWR